MVSGERPSVMGGEAWRSGVELRDLAKPEVAVCELGVRHGQFRLAHFAVSEAHNVEVERTRPPANSPHAPALRLDRVEVTQQLGRREAGLEEHHLVQVGILGDGAKWGGLLEARRGNETRARQG